MAAFFITATGTDIGKTFFTAELIKAFRAKQHHIHAIKPIISGYEDHENNNDTALIIEALGLQYQPSIINNISPFRYQAPLSPDMAAKLENKPLDYQALIHFCQENIQQYQDGLLLIEGVGGVLVPLSSSQHVIHWIQDINIPVILLTGSYLGSLSHTLTAFQCLQSNGCAIHMLVISESESNAVSLQQTKKSLQHWINEPIITIPRGGLYNRSNQDNWNAIIDLLDIPPS